MGSMRSPTIWYVSSGQVFGNYGRPAVGYSYGIAIWYNGWRRNETTEYSILARWWIHFSLGKHIRCSTAGTNSNFLLSLRLFRWRVVRWNWVKQHICSFFFQYSSCFSTSKDASVFVFGATVDAMKWSGWKLISCNGSFEQAVPAIGWITEKNTVSSVWKVHRLWVTMVWIPMWLWLKFGRHRVNPTKSTASSSVYLHEHVKLNYSDDLTTSSRIGLHLAINWMVFA